ncbi:MAG: 50S ribosome-binding GTPase [Phycisphaerae bacterium]|nr:50S ribosome-binding GTPase [Phycisphaerae bacterium]
MYDLNDTIVAVSSPSMGARVIVRITGAETLGFCKRVFSGLVSNEKSGLFCGSIALDESASGERIDAVLYLFRAPQSYTGEDIAEIHIHANSAVVEALMVNLLGGAFRMAGPGEFTARAYLNGKIDLAQAEAVNEIVSSSNTFQLAAAEKLLSGRLSESAEEIRSAIMDCLGLIEAGLDFSGEDIEFISGADAIERLGRIKEQLEQLLAGSIGYESVIDLPAVGIAGAPNAGKSSLVNMLLGSERSIVSHERKTTRDVLTGVLDLGHCRSVLFDCAGLLAEPEGILDELAQAAAIEALRNSSVVVLCVDASKGDWAEDIAVRRWIDASIVIPVATKSDLLDEDTLAERVAILERLFSLEFMPISTVSGCGIERLREAIDRELAEPVQKMPMSFSEGAASHVALTARHRRAVTEAIENIDEALDEFEADGTEVTAMMLRAAYQCISAIEQPQCIEVDEQILEQIFSRFCIGK